MPKSAILWTLCFVLTLTCAYLFMSLKLANNMRAIHMAQAQLYKAAALKSCMAKEAIISAAQAQGFYFNIAGKGLEYSLENYYLPEEVETVVDVDLEPDRLYSTDGFETFQFGSDGCWIYPKLRSVSPFGEEKEKFLEELNREK